MDALCKCVFIIIIETIVNSMKTRHVSKVINVFQRTCSCLFRHMKKRNTRFPLILFLCTEQFTDSNLFTFLQDRVAHFFWTCKMYIAYIVYYYICLPLCAHILYFDGAKFSMKQFSLICFTFSVVRQRNEYEKVIKTRPIKTT